MKKDKNMKLKFKNKEVELNELVKLQDFKVKVTTDFIKDNIHFFDIEEGFDKYKKNYQRLRRDVVSKFKFTEVKDYKYKLK